MNLTKVYEINSLTIEFNKKEIEQLQLLLNHYTEVAKFIAEKEGLLDSDEYDLLNLLKTIRRNLNEKL